MPASARDREALSTIASCSWTSWASISAAAPLASYGATSRPADAVATLTTSVRLPAGQRMRATKSTSGSELGDPSTAIMIFISGPPLSSTYSIDGRTIGRHGTVEVRPLLPSEYSFR